MTGSAPARGPSMRVDPDSLSRSHLRISIYGHCTPRSDAGCAPPLQIQTWPACERSPADYTIGEPEEPLRPSDIGTIRGVPARFYGNHRLELSTGDVTVVIFGRSRDLLVAAAQTLRTTPGS